MTHRIETKSEAYTRTTLSIVRLFGVLAIGLATLLVSARSHAASDPELRAQLEAEGPWYPVEVKHHRFPGVVATELLSAFNIDPIRAWMHWLDDDFIIFAGIGNFPRTSGTNPLDQRIQERTGGVDISNIKRNYPERGVDILIWDTKKNKILVYSDYEIFCYSPFSGEIRIIPIGSAIDYVGPLLHSKKITPKGFLYDARAEYKFSNLTCRWENISNFQITNKPLKRNQSIQLLLPGDGFLFVDNWNPLSTNVGMISNEGKLISELPITRAAWGGVDWLVWREKYVMRDRRMGLGMLYDDENGVPRNFDAIWREKNCLRLIYFDAQGNIEKKCVPYVRSGREVAPTKKGIFVVAISRFDKRDLSDNGLYFVPIGEEKAIKLIDALIVLRDIRISPNGCKSIFSLNDEAQNYFDHVLYQLFIFNVC